MTFYRWSTTAATNASSDATINWAEGQAPGTVNDSARAMMAATAKYRDDISGRLVTTAGTTATAYVINPSNQIFASLALMDGAMICFSPTVTCGNTVTLNVDTLGAKPLRTAPGVELTAGQLIAGTPYAATYNNGSAVWYVQNVPGNFAFSMPIGGITQYAGSTAPNSNYVLCNGQAISRATYATLFAITSTTYGVGDGSTTFNVPDLRGRVPAGSDTMGAGAAGRIGTLSTDGGTITGSSLGSTGGSQSHVQTGSELAAHSHTTVVTDPGHVHAVGISGGFNVGGTPSTIVSATGSTNTASAITNISVGINVNGSSAAMAWLQPTIILSYIIRVL